MFIANDKIFKSRKDAPSQELLFIYNDGIYGKYDWTQEPPETLDMLYATKARQLREKYDHLLLMYSGGADSHNVLMTFINNGIRLDEVHSVYPIGLTKNAPEGSILQEYDRALIPRYKQFDLKRFCWDNTDYFVQNYKNEKFFEENASSLIARQLYHALTSLSARQFLEKHIQTTGLKGKIGVIYGNDKVLMRRNGQEFFVYFSDATFEQPVSFLYDRIAFYWDDFPAIMCKQAHMVKRAFGERFQTSWFTEWRRSPSSHRFFYPTTYQPIWQQINKSTRDDGELFPYFFGDYGIGSIRDQYRNIVDPARSRILIANGKSAVTSRLYSIGKM